MKIKIFYLFIICFSVSYCFSNEKVKLMRVINIQDFKEAYLISCLFEKRDTILVVSEKYDNVGDCHVEIEKDKCYEISLINRPTININSFVVRVKNTVFWKKGDRIDRIPYFAKNIKGICIENNI